MTETIVNAKKLTKTYKLFAEEIIAVDAVDLQITAGEFVSIMGPSGSGKTTLLDMIGCLDSISSGMLEILGEDVSNTPESKLVKTRRGKIGFIFQDFSLIPSLTALENLQLALFFAGQKADRKKCFDMLEKVHLEHRSRHLPKQMSGGEQQRVAVARALVTEPKFLLADEPTGHLDTQTSQTIFSLLKEINAAQGLTVILATHDPSIGGQTQRTILLKDGKIAS
jgi:putative ABC transport system ATP-binding protein